MKIATETFSLGVGIKCIALASVIKNRAIIELVGLSVEANGEVGSDMA
jgi:hypothetical protein